ncbi:hypothetical protein HHI36_001728 [Cryptolaemus montrouzieri]|uniref:Transmembrane protein n=1 Tax=Cryptolaemus montrouzieri TaxID=559131 RepID=A0ABD2P8H0_9CUCU
MFGFHNNESSCHISVELYVVTLTFFQLIIFFFRSLIFIPESSYRAKSYNNIILNQSNFKSRFFVGMYAQHDLVSENENGKFRMSMKKQFPKIKNDNIGLGQREERKKHNKKEIDKLLRFNIM